MLLYNSLWSLINIHTVSRFETTVAHAGNIETCSLEAFERELTRLRAIVRMRLNVQRVCINRLPDEILSIILSYLGSDSESMFAVTRTCARFRSEALRLWTTLPTPNIYLTRRCLNSTGALPVRLCIRAEGARVTREHVDVLLQGAPDRITAIDTTFFSSGCAGAWLLERLLRQKLPNLKTLEIHYRTICSVPSTLFSMRPLSDVLDNFDHLTHLKLVNCGPMRLVLPLSLQNLELHNTLCVLSIQDFLESISVPRELNVLVIGLDPSPWENTFPAVSTPERQIALPSLCKLKVRGSWDLAAAVIHGTMLQSACSIEFETRTSGYIDDPSVTRALSALLQNPAFTPPQHLVQVIVSRYAPSSSDYWPIHDVGLLVENDSAGELKITLDVGGLFRPGIDINEDEDEGWHVPVISPFYARLLQFPSIAETSRLCIDGSVCDGSMIAALPFLGIQELAFHARPHVSSLVPELRVACDLFGQYPKLRIIEWIELDVPEGEWCTRKPEFILTICPGQTTRMLNRILLRWSTP